MATTVRELLIRFKYKDDPQGMAKLDKNIDRFRKQYGRSTEEMTASFNAGLRKVGQFAKVASVAVVGALGAIGASAIKNASNIEDLTVQFEVMLGSADKANALMDELLQFSKSTPFQLENLAQGTQQLLSFGVAEENVIDTMRMLGDTAGGNAQKLQSLVLAYGKVQVKGKASMEELNMLAERGLPIYSVLSEQLGVSREEFFKMVSAGKVSSDDITKAFQTMTSEGGLFYKGMEKQATTLSGLFSTFKDVVSITSGEIGKGMLPAMKGLLSIITEIIQGGMFGFIDGLKEMSANVGAWITANKELIKQGIENVFKGIATAGKIVFNVIKTIVNIVNVLKPILIPLVAGFIAYKTAMAALTIATGLASAAQAVWNAIMLANPIGLIIAGIVAFIAVIVLLVKNFDKVKEAFSKLWGNIKKVAENVFGSIVDSIKNVINGILKVINLIPGVNIPLLKLREDAEAENTDINTGISGTGEAGNVLRQNIQAQHGGAPIATASSTPELRHTPSFYGAGLNRQPVSPYANTGVQNKNELNTTVNVQLTGDQATNPEIARQVMQKAAQDTMGQEFHKVLNNGRG